MSDVRVPSPGPRYDPVNEAAFRRIVEQELSRALTELNIGGALLYIEGGVLKVKGTGGTVTALGPA